MSKSKNFKPGDQVFLVKDYPIFLETRLLHTTLILKALTKGVIVNNESNGTEDLWLVRFKLTDSLDTLISLPEINFISVPDLSIFNAEIKLNGVNLLTGTKDI